MKRNLLFSLKTHLTFTTALICTKTARASACLVLPLLFLVLHTSCSSLQSQDTNKCFVWKISKNNNSKSNVYLAGSIHIGKKELYPLNQSIEDAFDQSDILVVEQHIDRKSIAEIQRIVMKERFYPKDKTLEDDFSKESIDKLKSFMDKNKMNYELFKRVKPWFLMTMLEQLLTMKHGFNPEYGMENHFITKAKSGKKDIVNLETVDEQLYPMINTPIKEQEYLMVDLIDNADDISDIDKIFEAWKNGDAVAMNGIIFSSTENLPQFKKLVFDDRNLKMEKRIEKLLESDKNYFILIGSGHLVGTNGLIKAFQDKGYTVEQLEKK